MNKYREALLDIRYIYTQSQKYKKLQKYNAMRQLDTLQELVDKATPKKPKIRVFNDAEVWECAERLVEKEVCPLCNHKLLDKDPYCRFCGQAIDWSK